MFDDYSYEPPKLATSWDQQNRMPKWSVRKLQTKSRHAADHLKDYLNA